MTWAEQKPKGITFKVHSLAIENPLYMDLIHQCSCNGCHMRQCLNELQKEYCVKRKHITLDWQWVTLISWCQMNRLGHSSQVMHKVNIFKKLKITSPKSNLFGLFLRSIFFINFFCPYTSLMGEFMFISSLVYFWPFSGSAFVLGCADEKAKNYSVKLDS